MVGGGSYNWSPRLLCDLIQTPELENSEVVLLDINLQAAEDIKNAVDRLCADNNKKFHFTATNNEDEAFAGADFVVITISTGGLEMMQHDITIPEKYGIYQTVGDSVGPGGWARLLRNVPVFTDMALKIEKLSPGAVILNYTNPMAGLTGAISESTSLRNVGLCHGVFGTRAYLARIFEVDATDIALRYGGINHFFWILDFSVKGENGYKLLREKLGRDTLLKYDKASKDAAGFSDNNHELFSELYENFGYLTYSADRHTSEFFTRYLTDLEMIEKFKLVRTSMADRQDSIDKAKQYALDLAAGKEKIRTKSVETAVDIMKAFVTNKAFIDVVNLPNTGQIDNLPRGAVVETLGMVDAGGFAPICLGSMPESLKHISEVHCQIQLMTLEAAMTGNKKLALEALMLDPLCAKLTLSDVRTMASELLDATKDYLPRFK